MVILYSFLLWLIPEWFTADKLCLNLDIAYYSIFGPKHRDLKGYNLYRPTIGKIIQNVECYKYLGIFIDNHFKWQEHISNL